VLSAGAPFAEWPHLSAKLAAWRRCRISRWSRPYGRRVLRCARTRPQSEVFDPQDLLAADQLLIAAGTAWEHEIERLYALLLQQKHAHAYEEFARDFDEWCTIEGLSAALALLNSGVSHRYTAVYRAVNDAMVNVELADKLGEPRPDFLAQVPVASSFCQYVLRDASFLTANSDSDLRLNGHPYQGVMLAYFGVPTSTLKARQLVLCAISMSLARSSPSTKLSDFTPRPECFPSSYRTKPALLTQLIGQGRAVPPHRPSRASIGRASYVRSGEPRASPAPPASSLAEAITHGASSCTQLLSFAQSSHWAPSCCGRIGAAATGRRPQHGVHRDARTFAGQV
jgi:hypothetical protein